MNADFLREINPPEQVTIPANTTLFQEGQQPEYAYALVSGTCLLSQNMLPQGAAKSGVLLDELSVLGNIPHTSRAITITDCEFYRWRLDELRQHEQFNRQARHILATQLQQSQMQLAEVAAPVHHLQPGAQLAPGPFTFPNSTMIFVFCDAKPKLDLPQGVSKTGNTLLLVFADFPDSRYHHHEDWRFGYHETTFFVPVRVGRILGLFVPQIYSSAYEPILLGREIYGFPKQLGNTTIDENSAALNVNQQRFFDLSWGSATPTSEARIVGAMGRGFGAPGTLTSAAFSVGDVLTQAIQMPIYRHINVFNHKRITRTDTKHEERTYDVDQLTQVVFSIQRWASIERLHDVQLQTHAQSLQSWKIRVRDAYRTRLDLRLSTGRVVRDFRVS